jgi:2-polyprenyl-6-methoxyphenol hydroxylase-like FAD-dependent oxidoreductase
MGRDSDLLVVGAGPSGLTLALQASRMGAKVRVIERRSEPRVWAPALAIHPRTMEILGGLGVADPLVARGLSRVGLDLHIGADVVSGSLGQLYLPETEFPFICFAPQPEVEDVLASALSAQGVAIEWASEFKGMAPYQDGVVCRVETEGTEETVTARYLVGCDGADSAVRRDARIRFVGRSYRETISIADAGADLEPNTAHAFISGRGILFFFPLPSGRWRIIGPGARDGSPEAVRALVARHTEGAVEIDEIDWVKVLRQQHRLARAYRRGNAFLAGDAAHVHSPAGAQGMNTGIQDAANLGWKLALAVRGASASLLDTYETERRPVARHVVRLTGLAFALEVSDLAPLRWGRRWAGKPIAGLLAPHPRPMSVVARMVSGLDTRYRRGAVDPDRVSRLGYGAGRRLPDTLIDMRTGRRLHHLLDGRTFTLVIFDDTLDESHLAQFKSRHAVVEVTHAPDGVGGGRRRVDWVLVRPDGYIATSGRSTDLDWAVRYLDRWLGNQFAAARSTL